MATPRTLIIMGACVGKPTLDEVTVPNFGDEAGIDACTGRELGNRAGKPKGVPGPDHCRDRLLASRSIGRLRRERANPPPLCEAQRRCDRGSVGRIQCLAAVVFVDSGNAQVFCEAPLTVSAPAQRPRARQCVRRIVDQPEFGEAIRERIEVGGRLTGPAALTDFAGQVLAQLGPSGRIFADVPQRELAQRRIVQRPRDSAGLGSHVHAVFVPQSLAKGKAAVRMFGRNAMQ